MEAISVCIDGWHLAWLSYLLELFHIREKTKETKLLARTMNELTVQIRKQIHPPRKSG